MICLEILKNWLREKGFDGLVHRDSECGCTLAELIPCGDYFGDCEPASNPKIVSALCAGINVNNDPEKGEKETNAPKQGEKVN